MYFMYAFNTDSSSHQIYLFLKAVQILILDKALRKVRERKYAEGRAIPTFWKRSYRN